MTKIDRRLITFYFVGTFLILREYRRLSVYVDAGGREYVYAKTPEGRRRPFQLDDANTICIVSRAFGPQADS